MIKNPILDLTQPCHTQTLNHFRSMRHFLSLRKTRLRFLSPHQEPKIEFFLLWKARLKSIFPLCMASLMEFDLCYVFIGFVDFDNYI